MARDVTACYRYLEHHAQGLSTYLGTVVAEQDSPCFEASRVPENVRYDARAEPSTERQAAGHRYPPRADPPLLQRTSSMISAGLVVGSGHSR